MLSRRRNKLHHTYLTMPASPEDSILHSTKIQSARDFATRFESPARKLGPASSFVSLSPSSLRYLCFSPLFFPRRNRKEWLGDLCEKRDPLDCSVLPFARVNYCNFNGNFPPFVKSCAAQQLSKTFNRSCCRIVGILHNPWIQLWK